MNAPAQISCLKPEPIKPGIYPGIPAEQYHSGPGVSKSMLARMVGRSPRHSLVSTPSSKDMLKGTFFHTFILEPELFEQRHCPEYAPKDGDLITIPHLTAELKKHGLKVSGNKPELIQRLLEAVPDAPIADVLKERHEAGYEPIPVSVWDDLHYMRDGLMRHDDARDYLESASLADSETTGYWIDSETGLLCRCRPDLPIASRKVLLDLKKCRDASPRGFGKAMAEYEYPMQDIYYSEGWSKAPGGFQPDEFVFICVEDSPPYAAATYRTPEWALKIAEERIRECLATWKACSATRDFYEYQPFTINAEVPQYYQYR